MKSLRALPAALLILLVSYTASAQSTIRPNRDPRPLGRVDVSDIPKHSFTTQPIRRGALLDALVPVGRARLEPLSGSTTTLGNLRIGNAARTLGIDVRRGANGTSLWMRGTIGRVAATKTKGASLMGTRATDAALDVLQSNSSTIGIASAREELAVRDASVDDLGYQHFRFDQVYRGIPVWGRDVYVHANADGDVYLINGDLAPTLSASTSAPSIASDRALAIVIERLKSENRWAPPSNEVMTWLGMPLPTAGATYYPTADGSLRLAWEVTLHPNLVEYISFIIDAATGAQLNRIDLHCSLLPGQQHDHVAYTRAPEPVAASASSAAQFVDATGADLAGNNRSFRTYQHTNNVFYSAWDFPNFNAGKSTMPDEPSGGALVLTANNTDLGRDANLSHVISNNNTWSDPTAVSATLNQRAAFDYYVNTHGRKAIDDLDQSCISIIHVTQDGAGMDNAFWNGRVMAYGDGNSTFTALARGVDVAGHEMTHGVISSSANLVYQDQPGALNESMADVFGIMIDRDDFLIGEDIMRAGLGPALRDFENPDNGALRGPQPAHMNQFRNLTAEQDNGGVHINSGIPNRAAFMIIQAIGRDKTERIYYRALTKYLTRNSQFIDARNAVEQAAKDLFGDGGEEVRAVQNGFASVGIGAGASTNENDNDADPQSGGTSLIAFTLENGRIGVLNPATGEAGVFGELATSRVSSSGDRAQLSTGRAGTRIWFVSTDGKLSIVNVGTSEVSNFPNLNILEEGDIWNASVSPDENYVALVSSYAADPNLYFFDGSDVTRLELSPESSQDGIDVETIDYPDVVNWSPNMDIPRIAFDALNTIQVDDDEQSFWSMYEIDFANSKIFNLVNGQLPTTSIGNVTYTSNDPDVIAFSVIENGVNDVALADFAHNQMVALGISGFNIDGSPINDADRPTFAPNDAFLALTSAANQALLYVNLQTATLQFFRTTPPLALYNPEWFLVGGVTGVEAETGASASLALRCVPNPTGATSTISFSLPAASHARVEMFDAIGNRVATLADRAMPAGSHTLNLDATGIGAGVYVVRVQAGSVVSSVSVVVAH